MGRTETVRTNEQWLTDLRSSGEQADAAQLELRLLIRRGLRKTLARKGPVDDALLDDLTQVAAIRILEKLDTFRGASRFTTWAFSVAFRAAFSEIRRLQWRHVSLADYELESIPAEISQRDAGDAETLLQRKKIFDLLYNTIHTELTARQRQGILAELDGVPLAAIETKMGISRNALYKLLHDARMKLREGLAQAGVTEDDMRMAL